MEAKLAEEAKAEGVEKANNDALKKMMETKSQDKASAEFDT